MMDINDRIAQWQKMTQEAPDDMSWFSLGTAYKEAGRLDEAANALAQAIGLNPAMSRAYQEQGHVLVELGQTQEAIKVLTEGYQVADRRGDRAPQKVIEALLEKLGEPIPASVDSAPIASAPIASASGDTVIDRRTGVPGARMTEPPMRGPLGEFIMAHYSQETWREWIGQGTKVINELRLDFSKQEHQDAYEQQMRQWLEIGEDEVPVQTAAS